MRIQMGVEEWPSFSLTGVLCWNLILLLDSIHLWWLFMRYSNHIHKNKINYDFNLHFCIPSKFVNTFSKFYFFMAFCVMNYILLIHLSHVYLTSNMLLYKWVQIVSTILKYFSSWKLDYMGAQFLKYSFLSSRSF